MLNFLSSWKISGQIDKMHRNESKYKISSENYWDFPLYFQLYLKIGCFIHIPQFWQYFFFGYFKCQISRCHIRKKMFKTVSGHQCHPENVLNFNFETFIKNHHVCGTITVVQGLNRQKTTQCFASHNSKVSYLTWQL